MAEVTSREEWNILSANEKYEAYTVLEKLFADHDRLLREIPECPMHGNTCVPHALDWIRDMKQRADPDHNQRVEELEEALEEIKALASRSVQAIMPDNAAVKHLRRIRRVACNALQAVGAGPMKALTLWQPWASLVAAGVKQYETRSWATTYRGTLAIHAAKRWTQDEQSAARHLARQSIKARAALSKPDGSIDLPLGCVLCAVQLVAVHRVEAIRDELTREELLFGNYADGRFAWELKLLKVADPPIQAKGAQGLWDWTPQIHRNNEEGGSATRWQ